jgi:hypothetical protein
MSTLKTTNLQHASAASPTIVLASDGTATAQLSSVNGGPLSGARNRIINGDMRIDQRNAGAAVTFSSPQYTVDRWICEKNNLSTLVATCQRVADAPAGFNYSLKTTITTAQASSANSSLVSADQRIEGFNAASLAFGTASASSFTISFWVKASVTGTYPVSFFNWTGSGVNRAYLATYSISASNTWEYKQITVPGDTSGTWLTDNQIGLGVQFCTGGGTDANGTAGSWSSTYKSRTSACVDLNATLNATWQITGVQLEAGSVATPFERRSYGQELALCQRYFYWNGGSNDAAMFNINADNICGSYRYPVTMRATPTTQLYNGTTADQVDRIGTTALSVTSGAILVASAHGFSTVNVTGVGSGVGGSRFNVRASAEL